MIETRLKTRLRQSQHTDRNSLSLWKFDNSKSQQKFGLGDILLSAPNNMDELHHRGNYSTSSSKNPTILLVLSALTIAGIHVTFQTVLFFMRCWEVFQNCFRLLKVKSISIYLHRIYFAYWIELLTLFLIVLYFFYKTWSFDLTNWFHNESLVRLALEMLLAYYG